MRKSDSAGKPSAADDFYLAYAKAMLEWQKVESALLRFYVMLFKNDDLTTISAAYYSMESFGAKLRLVENTASCVLEADRMKQWLSIEKSIRAASAERNILAHLPAEIISHEDGSLSLELKHGFFVPQPLRRKKKRIYDEAGCDQLAHEFLQLSERIDELARVDAGYVTMFLGG